MDLAQRRTGIDAEFIDQPFTHQAVRFQRFGLTSASVLGEHQLRRETLENKVVEIDEVLDGIEGVTAEDVQRLARQVIVDDGLNLAIVGPFDDEQRFLDVMADRAAAR